MTVEQNDIIDGVGVERDGSAVVLVISDHLPWDAEHIRVLRGKLEAYVDAVLSGRLAHSYPAATGKPVVIDLVWREEPTPVARTFLASAREQIGRAGMMLRDGPLPSA